MKKRAKNFLIITFALAFAFSLFYISFEGDSTFFSRVIPSFKVSSVYADVSCDQGDPDMEPTPQQQAAFDDESMYTGGEVELPPTPAQMQAGGWNPEPGNPNAMTLDQNSALVGPIPYNDNTASGSPGGVVPDMGADGAGQGTSLVGTSSETGAPVLKDNATGQIYETGANGERISVPPDGIMPLSGAGGVSGQSGFANVESINGGQIIDDQGRQVVTNAQGQNGFIDNNGQFQPYDLSYGNNFFDAKTGQQMMMASTANNSGFYDVQFDANKNPYVLGEDGKTKWTFDSNGQMVATDENGKKMVLDANGNAVYESGGGAPAGASAMSPKGAGFSSAGLVATSGQQLFRGSNGQLYQQSGNQMVPYTGQTMMGTGGYTSASGGLSGIIGSAMSAVGSLFGSSSTPYAGSGLTGMTGLSGGMGGLGTNGYNNAGMALPTNMGLPSGTIQGVLTSFLYWLLGIFGLLALISFIVSGIMYFTAMGNKDEAEKAKKHMQWSIIGVIVGLGGMIIITSITTLFQGGTYF